MTWREGFPPRRVVLPVVKVDQLVFMKRKKDGMRTLYACPCPFPCTSLVHVGLWCRVGQLHFPGHGLARCRQWWWLRGGSRGCQRWGRMGMVVVGRGDGGGVT